MKLIQSTIFGLLFVAFVLTALLYDCERDQRKLLEKQLHSLDSIYTINYNNYKTDSLEEANSPYVPENYFKD